jgi:hypothetical protein
VDHIAEHGHRIGRREADRRAREADPPSVGQCLVQIPGETRLEAVLGPVRLVGDDDDVLPRREDGVLELALLALEPELLDGRNDNLAPFGP